MSMQDTIADMITRISNAQKAYKNLIFIPSSKIKLSIIDLLKKEGFIKNYEYIQKSKPLLKLELKYFKGKPVIEKIKRISRPGLRVYKKSNNLPKVMDGLGVAILSTSKGIMTDKQASLYKIGGEVICYIY